jgi:aspartate 1-decarboxylase
MRRSMMKSRIHRATVTDADLHSVGSITLDPELMELAEIVEFEPVHVLDIDNGARFETYAMQGARGSGSVMRGVLEPEPGRDRSAVPASGAVRGSNHS